MAQFALRWILMNEAVTCAIPGAKRVSQAEENIAAVNLPSIAEDVMMKLGEIYTKWIKPKVHQRW
jgi:aryl-alcohol dehydrogenase-like predicted oxidoreductase